MSSWKLLFNVWGVLFVFTLVSGLAQGQFDIFNTAVLAIGLTGLYGLAFGKAIWNQRFWRVFVIALFALIAITVVITLFIVLTNLDKPEVQAQLGLGNILLGLVYLALYFLQMYGLYVYAFKYDALWQAAAEGDE